MPLKIYKRPGSDVWWISGTVGGRRIRQTTGVRSEKLAAEICAAKETAEHRAVIHGRPAARRSFAEVALSYLEHGGPHAPETIAKVGQLVAYFGRVAAADDIDQASLDRACTALLRPGAKPATKLRQVISPIRAILMHGSKRKMCGMPTYDTGKASPGRTEWLSPAEMDALLNAASPHIRPLLAFLCGTGARLGEALSLDWCDVDLRYARVTLRDTKNGSDRLVDLCPRVMAALLTDPREKQGVTRVRAGRVFLTRAGKGYAKRRVQGGGQIKTAWKAALRRAGISKSITPHGLRHTWASWDYAEHRDLLMLRYKGAWSSVTLVERYAHVVPPAMVGAIQAWRAGSQLLAHRLDIAEDHQAMSAS